MGGGICGAALVRAADAMLPALGGDTVSLLLPATAMAGDAAGQLGLVDPGVQEILILPPVMREIDYRKSWAPAKDRVHVAGFGDRDCNCRQLGMGSAEDLFNASLD